MRASGLAGRPAGELLYTEFMKLAWVPYADRAEAELRLGGIPAGLDLDFYRADGDDLPATIGDVTYYVLPYLKGAVALERVADMAKLEVVQR
jgi:hypothetical protein